MLAPAGALGAREVQDRTDKEGGAASEGETDRAAIKRRTSIRVMFLVMAASSKSTVVAKSPSWAAPALAVFTAPEEPW